MYPIFFTCSLIFWIYNLIFCNRSHMTFFCYVYPIIRFKNYNAYFFCYTIVLLYDTHAYIMFVAIYKAWKMEGNSKNHFQKHPRGIYYANNHFERDTLSCKWVNKWARVTRARRIFLHREAENRSNTLCDYASRDLHIIAHCQAVDNSPA